MIWPEVVKSPLARRAVSGFSCSTVAERALRTLGSVREGNRGPADPVGAFKSGARADRNKVLTRGGFLPVGLLGKGGRGSQSCRLLLDRKKGRAATAITRQRRVELHSRSRRFGVGIRSPQTSHHRMAGRWRSRTPSLKGAACRRSSLTTVGRMAGAGGAWCAGSRTEAERSGVRGECSRRLNSAAAEGGGARSVGSRRRRSSA